MALEPEKDDLAEEETDEAGAPPAEPVVAKSGSAVAKPSAKVASATSSSAATSAKGKPVVLEEEEDEDEDEDEAPPPPPKKVVKKKSKNGKAAVVPTKAKPVTKRRKVGPKKPAKAFIPHVLIALAFGAADSRMNADQIPFHPLAVIGIVIMVWAFINIGSANEVGTETA